MNVLRNLWSALSLLANNLTDLAHTVSAANVGLKDRMGLTGPSHDLPEVIEARVSAPLPETADNGHAKGRGKK